MYASIAAIQALKSQNVPHPRIVGLVETCEESGSYDLLPYVDALRTRLGDVGLVICLDSGAGNYDQLWLTTSLRGMASGVLKVQILTEGVHSGRCQRAGAIKLSHHAPGAGPPRRQQTGTLLPQSFHCEIPADRLVGRRRPLRKFWATRFTNGFHGPLRLRRRQHLCAAHHHRPGEALLNRTWKPTLSVTGADGFPEMGNAGNVLRPYTAFKLSLRLPPLVDAARGGAGAQGPA